LREIDVTIRNQAGRTVQAVAGKGLAEGRSESEKKRGK
jgi:hypothetical protein